MSHIELRDVTKKVPIIQSWNSNKKLYERQTVDDQNKEIYYCIFRVLNHSRRMSSNVCNIAYNIFDLE